MYNPIQSCDGYKVASSWPIWIATHNRHALKAIFPITSHNFFLFRAESSVYSTYKDLWATFAWNIGSWQTSLSSLRYDATRNVWILDDSPRRRPLSLLYRIRITKGVAWYCLQVLYNVLSSGYRRYGLPSRTPYNLAEGASRTRSRHQLMNPKRNRRAALNASDCEDNSSGGEEDFTQVGIFLFSSYFLSVYISKLKEREVLSVFFVFPFLFFLFCEITLRNKLHAVHMYLEII